VRAKPQVSLEANDTVIDPQHQQRPPAGEDEMKGSARRGRRRSRRTAAPTRALGWGMMTDMGTARPHAEAEI
jgi:hypothetical protein